MGSILLGTVLLCLSDFFIGISLGKHEKFKIRYLLIISVSVLCACLIGFFLSRLLIKIVSFDLAIVVGVLFIALGIKDFFEKHDGKHVRAKSMIKKTMLLTAVLCIDASSSVIALFAEAYSVLDVSQLDTVFFAGQPLYLFLIPFLVTFFTLIFTVVGNIFIQHVKISQNAQRILASICLVTIGILIILGIL